MQLAVFVPATGLRAVNRYYILIEGENLLVNLDGKLGRYGFFTSRLLCANDAADAEIKAFEIIKNELSPLVLNDLSDPPNMHASEILEIESFGEASVPGSGFTWYPE